MKQNPIPYDPLEAFTCRVLSNGLTCYIMPKKGYVEKQALLCVRYGSVDRQFQANGQTYTTPAGVAHFLEHKLFEGETVSAFDQFIELGANVNAFTSHTATAYYFSAVNRFEECLSLLLDFVQAPYFTNENVAKEKDIILQEIAMYDDSPFWQLGVQLLEALYHDSPLRQSIAGAAKDIEAIDKTLLYHCYNAFYTPDNMALICAGDVDPDAIMAMAEKHIPPKPVDQSVVSRLNANEPAHVQAGCAERKMPLSRPMLAVGFKESQFHPQVAKRMADTKILLDLLFGESSTFFNDLYSQGTIDGPFHTEYVGSDTFGWATITCSCDNPKAVHHALLEEIQRVNSQGIDEKRLAQMIRKHTGRFIRGLDSLDVVTTVSGDLVTKGSNLQDLWGAYRQCNSASVTQRLRNFLNPEACAYSAIYPT